MKEYVNVEVDQQTIRFQQMGGKVKVINSKLCYVDFDISGFKLQYVYNVNKKGNYFLERIKPYPLALKEFETEQDIVDIIAIDVDQFRNAIKSHNASTFVDIARQLNLTLKKFEDLFLYYNVSAENVTQALTKLNDLSAEIDCMKEESKRIYFKKEPDNL